MCFSVNFLGSRSEASETVSGWQRAFRAVSSASRVAMICPEAIVTFCESARGTVIQFLC